MSDHDEVTRAAIRLLARERQAFANRTLAASCLGCGSLVRHADDAGHALVCAPLRARATPPTPDPRERGEAEPTLLDAHTLLAVIEKRDSVTLSLAEAQAMNRLVRALRAPARGVTVTEAMVREWMDRHGLMMSLTDARAAIEDARTIERAAITPDAEGGR